MTNVFRAVAPVIVWLGLANGATLGTTPGHEVWTLERGWGFVAELTPGEHLLDMAGTPVRIAEITLDPRLREVYNLEVDGTFTYYADGVWVHNSSCGYPAYRIASGHAWYKHRRDFERIGINSPEELTAYIEAMMVTHNPRQLERGRSAWLDESSGLVIIYDPAHGDKGTAFIPTSPSPLEYFHSLR